MYHCTRCSKEFENSEVDLDNYHWEDGNLVSDIVCECGGSVVAGIRRRCNVCGPGDYRHISDSLAISPDQIPEHRQHFPDVEVLPDGRPKFTSVKQQERYLDATGFFKEIKKRGPRTKRINSK